MRRDAIVLRAPDDFHLHLRRGPAMAAYAARSASAFARALVMPNVEPVPRDEASLRAYGKEIRAAAPSFEALLSFKILPGMNAVEVASCAAAGAIAGKLYPAGATTNSRDGIARIEDAADALREMERLGLVLSIHGEDPAAPAMEREAAYLPVVDRLVRLYPALRIVFEHVSTREAVDAVKRWPDTVAATVTAHHLALTIDDMLGEGLNPHLFCKPLLKTADDREAIRDAAANDAKFFFGSDSAPHPRARKEAAVAAAGIYSSPVALSVIAEEFEAMGCLERIEGFTSVRGARFYGLPPNEGTITLVRESWEVPAEVDGVVPLCAGRTLEWKAE